MTEPVQPSASGGPATAPRWPRGQNAGFARRLGAMVYDALLAVALLILGTLPFVAARGGEHVAAGDPLYQLVMFLILYVFFTGFWAGYGRTLGMQSWGIRIETVDGRKPSLWQASLRFLAAIVSWLPAGLGYWWQLLDPAELSWHDRLSGTRLRHYPRQAARR